MRREQISIVFILLNNNYNYHVGMENMERLVDSCYKNMLTVIEQQQRGKQNELCTKIKKSGRFYKRRRLQDRDNPPARMSSQLTRRFNRLHL